MLAGDSLVRVMDSLSIVLYGHKGKNTRTTYCGVYPQIIFTQDAKFIQVCNIYDRRD